MALDGNESKEKDSYHLIKCKIEDLAHKKYDKFHFEITATKGFSNKLKSMINKKRELIFNFLKEAKPDITGFVIDEYRFSENVIFIAVEIKQEQIKLEHIYQIKKYVDLLNAKIGLLISLDEIPEEIKRLSTIIKHLLSHPDGARIILAHFDCQHAEFKEWFPKNPFKSSWF